MDAISKELFALLPSRHAKTRSSPANKAEHRNVSWGYVSVLNH